ncbi:MAG: NADP-dependent malic enzyme [Candidatus Fermentibacteraceae bacterium]|nr:NADP-dependent malic enzyme [Candidatus Fermentibacteraceae bacterium]
MTPNEALYEIRKVLSEENAEKATTEFLYELAMDTHEFHGGKMMTIPLVDEVDNGWLEVWYTPGVSSVSRSIRDNNQVSFSHTARGRTVAVVSDSTRVLGDGDCTPPGGMGVMEGKALLMKLLGGFDAVPVCVDVNKDVDRLVDTVNAISPSFGAINLEDISQPECYIALKKLQKSCPVPVWHDDAQGTGCVVLAGLLNSLKVVNKRISDVSIVFFGAGAANSTTARLVIAAGADPERITMFDEHGALGQERSDFEGEGWEWHRELCRITNSRGFTDIREAVVDSDVFIAASKSGPDVVHPMWIKKMADDAIVFACANPVPEIFPSDALNAGAVIVATGRGDYPNQVNNSLGFPGILKGVLLTGATAITDRMAVAAARAIADYAVQGIIGPGRILPSMADTGLFPHVAAKVASAAQSEGVAKFYPSEAEVFAAANEDMENSRKAWAAVTASGAVKHYPGQKVKELMERTVSRFQ